MSVDLYIQVPPDGSGKKIRAIQETNLSGDVVYSKVVKVSGEVAKISGQSVVVASGVVDASASGNIVIAKISAESVVVTSGVLVSQVSGEVVRVSGQTLVVASGAYLASGVYLASGMYVSSLARCSGQVVRISGENVVITSGTVSLVSGGFVSALVSGTVIAKGSGEIVTTRPSGYDKAVVSGAVLVNVVSRQVVLHTVIITDRTSGYYMRVRDACSGALGTIIAMPYATTRATEPATIVFDCIMTSGIVVDTSGTTWHATVTYRKPF